MALYRRRLPHVFQANAPVFLTWRLAGSLPHGRVFPPKTLQSGDAFVAMDRLLDAALVGPTYLRHPEIAGMVVKAIRYNCDVLEHYQLHSFVVMPNHVHMLITPALPIPLITKSLKGITSRRANEALSLTGRAFWQEETFDRLVRDADEYERICQYIEQNPVKAGLARVAEEFPWTSAV